jgi:predicted lipoprotein with Yx(FWY)xxD motif
MKRLIPIALIVVAAVVAGCGGGSSNGGSYSASAATPKTAAANSTIATRTGSLGTYLVDGKGRALYLFEADKPNVSNCSGGCASIWPPASANGKTVAGNGVVASKLGMTSGANPIVTYNGHPLYSYAGDKAPGDTNGQDINQFGASWYVVSPAGQKIGD